MTYVKANPRVNKATPTYLNSQVTNESPITASIGTKNP